jgi:hypothetical protein
VVIAVNSEKSRALLVRPVSGGEPRELVRIDKEKEYPGYGSLSWTSDGRSIFFLKGAKGSGAKRGYPREWQLRRVAVEGGEPQPVGRIVARQLQGVRVYPDGRRVAIDDLKVDLEVWVMEKFLPPSKTDK